MTLRSVELFISYEPGAYIELIGPTPLLMVVALGDHLTVADEALDAYARARQPKPMVTLKGGHFDGCVAALDAASRAAPRLVGRAPRRLSLSPQGNQSPTIWSRMQ